jgi:hypothetical protein
MAMFVRGFVLTIMLSPNQGPKLERKSNRKLDFNDSG